MGTRVRQARIAVAKEAPPLARGGELGFGHRFELFHRDIFRSLDPHW